METNKVILRVYDIGNEAITKTISLMIGKEIKGIFHTSVEVFGSEFYFQNKITMSLPNKTTFGNPVRIHTLGETSVTREMLEEYLEILEHKYNSSSYHLIHNNCNNFTDTVCLFLVEKNIPRVHP
ncbi:hypothetical protein NBO_1039g0002 [Nosema bombycis CQ1]|uniref:PPPDE domain-containing protein n=1 Tax=Nosema bombycis (strain CQ1 / CVCC 102059) TaxID=578461 RepID=R0KN63_NOSB1|nr:hypothetical protein NBO_1039g0002 [Nosema bombycis CQ1]|eukprot:EOB11587.1 hypothetical protein NBO_1039g0002 [Nosema bombycis CQ1]